MLACVLGLSQSLYITALHRWVTIFIFGGRTWLFSQPLDVAIISLAIMDVDPEILARFVESLKLHGAEHMQGVTMKKEICATILNVRANSEDAFHFSQIQ